MLRALTFAILMLPLIALVPEQARAQNTQGDILTVDQDRLFTDSAFGQRALRDHESRAQTLSQENRGIEAGLIAEERDLTEQRSTLPSDEFRTLADAFDDKVQRIRAEQDAKAAALGRLRDEDRQQFLGLIGPVLQGLVIDRGALMLLDRRVVILSADSIDITDAAIARIDRDIGDGGSATQSPDQGTGASPPESDPSAAGSAPPENLTPQGADTDANSAETQVGTSIDLDSPSTPDQPSE